MNDHDLIDAIDRRLPQTQCTKCDYPNCRDYARAVAGGEADINQCPPGGTVTINALAKFLRREVKPLNPDNGVHQPLRLAFIVEDDCIGCKLCIQVCPVDCIVGAVKLMHTVIANDCTGCELCVPVCPTDCIEMVTPPADYGDGEASLWQAFSQAQVNKSRRRATQKRERENKLALERRRQKKKRRRESLQKEILAAVERKQSSS